MVEAGKSVLIITLKTTIFSTTASIHVLMLYINIYVYAYTKEKYVKCLQEGEICIIHWIFMYKDIKIQKIYNEETKKDRLTWIKGVGIIGLFMAKLSLNYKIIFFTKNINLWTFYYKYKIIRLHMNWKR